MGLGNTKEKTAYSYGGFLMFLKVSKIKINICSGGFLVGYGSTTIDVTLSFVAIKNTKPSIGRMDFGWLLEA